MRKILAILPFLVTEATRTQHEQALQRDATPRGTSVTAVGLQEGPTPADYSRPGFQYAVAEIVRIARRHHDEYDGIVISCFEDPGLADVRSVVGIPVVGPCQTALQLANFVGGSFFIVSPDREAEPLVRRSVSDAGLTDRFASFVHMPFEIEGTSYDSTLPESTAGLIKSTRKTTHAETAILGCTAFTQCYDTIRDLAGGRIIEPARASIRMLEHLIDLESRSAFHPVSPTLGASHKF
jgi:allantoin racemase